MKKRSFGYKLFITNLLIVPLCLAWSSQTWATPPKVPKVKLDMIHSTYVPLEKNGRCPLDAVKVLGGNNPRPCLYCGPESNGYMPSMVGNEWKCFRLQVPPHLATPGGYQPKMPKPDKSGKCPKGVGLVSLGGKKRCASCKSGYKWSEYYGQGRCVRCNQSAELRTLEGGKIVCMSCPRGALLSPVGHPMFGYRCSCPGGAVLGWSEEGYRCLDPNKY